MAQSNAITVYTLLTALLRRGCGKSEPLSWPGIEMKPQITIGI